MFLSIDLVPETCFGSNLRTETLPGEWDAIRRAALAAQSSCECCGVDGPGLHCHERWTYRADERHRGVQALDRIEVLCWRCHEVRHLGFAERQGRLDPALKHLADVVGITEASARQYANIAFLAWRLRSCFRWDISLPAGTLPNQVNTERVLMRRLDANQSMSIAEDIAARRAEVERILRGQNPARKNHGLHLFLIQCGHGAYVLTPPGSTRGQIEDAIFEAEHSECGFCDLMALPNQEHRRKLTLPPGKPQMGEQGPDGSGDGPRWSETRDEGGDQEGQQEEENRRPEGPQDSDDHGQDHGQGDGQGQGGEPEQSEEKDGDSGPCSGPCSHDEEPEQDEPEQDEPKKPRKKIKRPRRIVVDDVGNEFELF